MQLDRWSSIMINCNMHYFIVFRPLQKFFKQDIPKIVRPIKKASNSLAIAVEFHPTNSLGQNDPHLHIIVRTNDLAAFLSRCQYFLPERWAINHCAPCYSPIGAMIYAANKPGAEPVFYHGYLVELS